LDTKCLGIYKIACMTKKKTEINEGYSYNWVRAFKCHVCVCHGFIIIVRVMVNISPYDLNEGKAEIIKLV